MTREDSSANRGKAVGAARRKIVLTRTYEATLAEIWSLWTTAKGIESWWGPEGFTVKVHKLDLWPEGEMTYSMTATGPSQVEFMKRAGMPLTTDARLTYTDVRPMECLSYVHLVDFVPGLEAYDVATLVEFHAEQNKVRMVVNLDAMHNDEWTQRAVGGWESQLTKLEKLFRRVNEN